MIHNNVGAHDNFFLNNNTGAVLISKKFVLAAAHCRDADVDFAIGPTMFDGGIKSNFVDSKIHRSYDELTYSNDIAIFKLEEAIENVPYIRISNEVINNNSSSTSALAHQHYWQYHISSDGITVRTLPYNSSALTGTAQQRQWHVCTQQQQ